MGDSFDTTNFHHEVNDEVDEDRADRIGADRGMDIDVVGNEADVDSDELVKYWDLNMRRQAGEVNHEIMQIAGA